MRTSEGRTRMTLEDVAEEVLNGLFCHYEPPVTEHQQREAMRGSHSMGRSSSDQHLRTPIPLGSRSQSKSILRTSRSFRDGRSRSSGSASRSVTWRDQNGNTTTSRPADVDQRISNYAMSSCDFFGHSTAEQRDDARKPTSLADTHHIQGRRNSGDSVSSRRRPGRNKSGRSKSPRRGSGPGYIQTTPTKPQPMSGPPKRVLYDDEGNPILEDEADPADEDDPLQIRNRREDIYEPSPLSQENEEPMSPNMPSPTLLNPFCGFGAECWPRYGAVPPTKVKNNSNVGDTDVDLVTPSSAAGRPYRTSSGARTGRSPTRRRASPDRRGREQQRYVEDSEDENESEEESDVEGRATPRRHARVPPLRYDQQLADDDDDEEEGNEEKTTPRRKKGRKWYKRWRRPQTPNRESGESDDVYTSDNEGSIIGRLGRAVKAPARRFRSGRSKSPSRNSLDDSDGDSGIVDRGHYRRQRKRSASPLRPSRRSSNATSAAVFRPERAASPSTPGSYVPAASRGEDEYNIGYKGSFERRARTKDFDEDGMRRAREGRHDVDRDSIVSSTPRYDQNRILPTNSDVAAMSPRSRRQWTMSSHGWIRVDNEDNFEPASESRPRNRESSARRGSLSSARSGLSSSKGPQIVPSYSATLDEVDSPTFGRRINAVRSSERRSRRSFDSSYDRTRVDEFGINPSMSVEDTFDPESKVDFAHGGRSYGDRRRRVSDPLPEYYSRQRSQESRDEEQFDEREADSFDHRRDRASSPGGRRIPAPYDDEDNMAPPERRGFREPTPRNADPVIASQEKLSFSGQLPPTPRRDFSPELRRPVGRPETPVMSKIGSPLPRLNHLPPRDPSSSAIPQHDSRRELLRTLSPTSLTATLDTEKEIREEVSSVGMESNTIRPLLPNPFMSIPPDIVPSQNDEPSEGTAEDPSTLSSDPLEHKAHVPITPKRESGQSGSDRSSKKKLFGGLRKMKFGKVKAIAKDIDQQRLPSPGAPYAAAGPMPGPSRRVSSE